MKVLKNNLAKNDIFVISGYMYIYFNICNKTPCPFICDNFTGLVDFMVFNATLEEEDHCVVNRFIPRVYFTFVFIFILFEWHKMIR
jgi:hypothetical protein